MKNAVIEKRSLEMRATDALRERILTGDLTPGGRLTEVNLSTQLQLSRATIRAALNRLAAEQLVDLKPYAGWSVRPLTARDAWELYTLRASLEGLAARLAAESITREKSEKLEKSLTLLARVCESNDANAVAAADYALHSTIIDISQHGRLRNQYMSLAQQVHRYIILSDELLTNKEDVLSQHKPMVAAILNRDAQRAEEIAKSHNLSEGKILVENLLEQESKLKLAQQADVGEK
jgi:DNA-binding GntR family transcriptional regulator